MSITRISEAAAAIPPSHRSDYDQGRQDAFHQAQGWMEAVAAQLGALAREPDQAWPDNGPSALGVTGIWEGAQRAAYELAAQMLRGTTQEEQP